jgi:hypothetical protein
MMLWPGLLGAGLGIYIPANNAAIMAAIPERGRRRHGGADRMEHR